MKTNFVCDRIISTAAATVCSERPRNCGALTDRFALIAIIREQKITGSSDLGGGNAEIQHVLFFSVNLLMKDPVETVLKAAAKKCCSIDVCWQQMTIYHSNHLPMLKFESAAMATH